MSDVDLERKTIFVVSVVKHIEVCVKNARFVMQACPLVALKFDVSTLTAT